MKLEKEVQIKGLTDINQLIDIQFGKLGTTERKRFRKETKIYVNGHAKVPECRNSQKVFEM